MNHRVNRAGLLAAAGIILGLTVSASSGWRALRRSPEYLRIMAPGPYRDHPDLYLALSPHAANSYNPVPGPAPSRGPTDPAETQRFLEAVIPPLMAELHVPGATFSMVHNGKLFFARGYGYADLQRSVPVDPDRTLFRVASVSKLFMATAAMQLAEQGKLGLNRDVNRYLKKFKIKKAFGKPVTMANLLTHTAGFDEQVIGMAARSQKDQRPLGDYLARRMPPRVMPPGSVVSYSNHGSALAGYLIQEISGLSFNDYMDRKILKPLQMTHSSFQLPGRLKPDMAVGYDYDPASQQLQPIPFDYLNVAPAGALNTTAADISHFMIAHLQDGKYGDVQILQPESAQVMHERQFTHHSRLPGFCFGFFERFQNGERCIGHDGLWRGFATTLILIPGESTGFFVSCNATQPLFGELVARALLNHYYPPTAQNQSGADRRRYQEEDLKRFEGVYRFNRYDRHTPLKLAALFSDLRISAGAGALTVHIPFGGSTQWVPVEPLLFRLKGGHLLMAFRATRSGRITHAFIGIAALDRLPASGDPDFQARVLSFSLGVFFLSVLVGLGSLGWGSVRTARGRAGAVFTAESSPEAESAIRPRPGQSSENSAVTGSRPWLDTWRALAMVASLGNLLFVMVFPEALMGAGFTLAYGMPALPRLLLCIPLITSGVALALLASGPAAWKKWNLLARLHYGLLTAALLIFTWLLNYWNLLGFRF